MITPQAKPFLGGYGEERNFCIVSKYLLCTIFVLLDINRVLPRQDVPRYILLSKKFTFQSLTKMLRSILKLPMYKVLIHNVLLL